MVSLIQFGALLILNFIIFSFAYGNDKNIDSLNENGHVIFIRGEAHLIRNNEKINLIKNQKIHFDDQIVVGEKSLVIVKVGPYLTTKIEANSELTILPKQNEKEQINGEAPLFLKKGSAFFKLLKMLPTKKVIIKAQNVAMGIRGTEFFASYGQEIKGIKEFWMCVEEGQVEISTKNHQQIVSEGEGVKVIIGEKITPPKVLPWTKKLNWDFSENAKSSFENFSMDEAYSDPLAKDYD